MIGSVGGTGSGGGEGGREKKEWTTLHNHL